MLENSELFAGLEQEDLAIVEACAKARQYRKSTVVISQGDASDSLYVVISGELRAFMANEEGKEIILGALGPGDAFGELALLDGGPRSASVITVEPATLAVISHDCFLSVLEQNPRISVNLLRTLARRTRALVETVGNLALLDVYGRVARILLQLAKEEDGVRMIHRITHQEIANMAGSSREMVSKIMKDLRKGGYISVEGKDLRINQRLPARW